jgi:hypothetical protein
MFIKQALIICCAVFFPISAMAADDAYANIHSVSIVSKLGDGVTLTQNSDLSVTFDSSQGVLFHTGLDIDGYVTGKVKEALAARFEIQNVALPISSEDADGKRAPSDVDAFIIIHPVTFTVQTIFRTVSTDYVGLNINYIKALFGVHNIMLGAEYAVSVVDAKTGKEIDYGTAVLPPQGIFGIRQKPNLLCGDAIWPATPEHPDDTSATQIRADLMALIASTLPGALEHAHLIANDTQRIITQWEGTKTVCKTR